MIVSLSDNLTKFNPSVKSRKIAFGTLKKLCVGSNKFRQKIAKDRGRKFNIISDFKRIGINGSIGPGFAESADQTELS